MQRVNRHKRHRRIRGRVRGTAQRPRVSVFRSNRSVSVQFIDDVAGVTVAAVVGAPTAGQNKTSQAEALGTAAAKAAQAKGITQVVFDRSGYRYHGRIKALAEALRAGGLDF